MKRKIITILKYIEIFIFILCIGLGSYFIYKNYFQKEETPLIPSVEELIEEKEQNNYQDKEENKIDVQTYINHLPEYRAQYGNPNIMGKLEIPNININALVTRTTDNSFYLENNIYNQRDGLGVPFFDYRNTDLVNSQQLNIYGHNTTNEKFYDRLPFINLEAYTNENIFQNYKDVYLSIDQKQIHYQVIAIKIITKQDNEHMKVKFRDEQDFLGHTFRLLQNTLYKVKDLEIKGSDQLLVMQVCHYDPPGTYLLVICKAI